MTTLGRALVFVTLPLLLAGCATLMLVAATATTAHADTTRYTWTGGDVSLLPQVNLACAKDMEKSYIPRFGGGSVLRTLYKDCVRNSGYIQARESEKGPEVAYTYEVVDGVGYHRYRLESCGSPDQTCLWIAPPRFMGMGGGWGIAPLPAATQSDQKVN